MKFLALLFLVGVAVAAPFHDELDHAADEIARDFMASMELSPIFMKADEGEEDVTTELGKKLRETMDHILEKIREAIDKGKTVKEDVLEKLKEVREKMKELGIEVSEKAKELFRKIKDRVKDYLKKILDRLGLDKDKEERSLDEDRFARSIVETLREKFEKLREAFEGNFDLEAIKEKVRDLFGKHSVWTEKFMDMLKEGKEKVKEFIDRFLKKDGPNREERSLQEIWERIRDYFKNLKIEIKERYAKFGEWVRDNMGKKLDEGKSALDNVKKIAEEYIVKIKEMNKDVATQGMNFINEYKEKLGDLWEQVKEKFKERLQKED